MTIKNFLNYFFVILIFLINIFFIIGCGKNYAKDKKNPNLARTYYKLSLLDLSDSTDISCYKRALVNIDKAIKFYPKPEYFAFKATVLFKLGQEKEGNKYFSKALNLNPKPVIRGEILNNQACLLAQTGFKKNKKQKITQALTIWKNLEIDKDYLTPEVACVNCGKAYITLNSFEDAKKYLLKAVSISPNYLDAHYYLALVSYKTGDLSLAKNEINTVLFLEPDHKPAKQLNDSLNNNS